MKLSGWQIFWMIATMDVGMTLIMTFTPSLQAAGQDVWMSMLISGLIALGITWIVTRLTALYPGKTLIEFCRIIMGKPLGNAIIFLYLIQWFTIIPIVLRQFNDFIQIMLLPTTPKQAILAVMIALVVYAVSAGGIEGVGRTSEILGPLVFVMIGLVVLACFTSLEPGNLLPVLADSGWRKIAEGSLYPASYLGHSVEYLMLAAFVPLTAKGSSAAFWGVLTASVTVLVCVTMIVATIGVELSPGMWYPFFEMTRKISLLGFLDNFDPFTIVIWIASVFVKLSIYLFVASYGTAQFLNVVDWRRLIWPIAPVIFFLALVPRNMSDATSHYLLNYWLPISLPVNMIGLPLLLLIVGNWRVVRTQRQTR